jgi:hypothetical protein
MLATILSLLGGGLGGLMRLAPEIIKLFTLKKDQDHEFRMTTLQLQIDQARAAQEIDKIHANEMLEGMRGEMSAYTEALKGQGQMSGVKWIDGLNQSVRPFLTYWWMILFTIYKVNVIYNSNSLSEFMVNLWTTNDAGILSMILGFWFVDRAIKWMGK